MEGRGEGGEGGGGRGRGVCAVIKWSCWVQVLSSRGMEQPLHGHSAAVRAVLGSAASKSAIHCYKSCIPIYYTPCIKVSTVQCCRHSIAVKF